MFDDCIIMAGGSGTRLWPASSSRLPKQFLPANDKQSFFSLALERAFALTSLQGRVIVITGKSHISHVVSDAKKLEAAEKKRLFIIGEAVAKNTAPAIACAVVFSQFAGSGRKVLVLTSDHIIKPLKTFKNDAAIAASAAAQGKLVVFGIPPSRPETGYGYIETNKGQTPCDVKAFHEKPDLKTAQKYAASSSFFWNSGMFAFSADFMAEEFHRLAPDVIAPFKKLKAPQSSFYTKEKGIRILNKWPGLDNAYRKTKAISFDYAIAEKCSKTVMVRTNFDWIDIGNWEEYAKVCGNMRSQVFNVPAQGSFGETCYVDSDIPVALAGVEDLIVVIRSGKDGKPAAALITKKGQTQKVRDIVEKIKKNGKSEILL